MNEQVHFVSTIWSATSRDLQIVWLQAGSSLTVAASTATLVAIVSLLIGLCHPVHRKQWALVSGVAFVAAFIGFLTGHVTGNSRTPATGDIIPVLLAGVGGIFVLSLNHERISTYFAGVFVLSFGLTFFQGATLGAFHRNVSAALASQSEDTASLVPEEGNEALKYGKGDWWQDVCENGGCDYFEMQDQPSPLPFPVPPSPLPLVPTQPYTIMPVPPQWNLNQLNELQGSGN